MAVRVGINGFGRIGRLVFRNAFKRKNIEIVAINDLPTPTETLAHLLKYDSNYGKYEETVKAEENSLIVGEKKISVFTCKNPAEIPWRNMGVDIVIAVSYTHLTLPTKA